MQIFWYLQLALQIPEWRILYHGSAGLSDSHLNLFRATGLSLHPLKTSENLWFSDVSGFITGRHQRHEIGYYIFFITLIYVNVSHLTAIPYKYLLKGKVMSGERLGNFEQVLCFLHFLFVWAGAALST